MQNAFYLKKKKRPTEKFNEKKNLDKQSFMSAFFPDKEEKDANRTRCAAVKIQH